MIQVSYIETVLKLRSEVSYLERKKKKKVT